MTIETLLTSVIITIIPIGSYIPGTLYKCGNSPQGNLKGLYSWNTIYICGQENNRTKYHELGHHFWTFLSEDQKTQYTKLYTEHRSKGIKHFYSKYAMSNELEDFAENFLLVSQKKRGNTREMNARIKLILDFLGK